MTYRYLTVEHTEPPLPHDSPKNNDKWAIFRALRDTRSAFGLKPSHLQTLQALLSFLKPGHGETVFASNNSICQRIGGIDERTLRRHVKRFIELGFIERHDSSNQKRYRIHSSNGYCISFGLSLTPLFQRSRELSLLAQEMEEQKRDMTLLRKQVQTNLAILEEHDPTNDFLPQARKSLRRKLELTEYRDLLAKSEAELRVSASVKSAVKPADLPGNDGQIVRHYSDSNKININIEEPQTCELPDPKLLIAVCNQATSFAINELDDWNDIRAHARILAPMMGIHTNVFDMVQVKIGSQRASCAIFIVLQLSSRIRNLGAYFHSITLGKKSVDFNPSKLLKNLSLSQRITSQMSTAVDI